MDQKFYNNSLHQPYHSLLIELNVNGIDKYLDISFL